MMAKKDKGKPKGKGLTPQVFSGLNRKRMAKGTGGNRCQVPQGTTVTVMILDTPDEMMEFNQHQFRDGGKWNYVPCAGDNCPLCQDDDEDVRKIHYRFITNVYNMASKQVEILEGPKSLSGRIMQRYDSIFKKKKKVSKANAAFLAKVYDISKLKTTPVEWDVETADDDRLSESKYEKLKKFDLKKDIEASMERYFGDGVPAGGSKTALDDDDEEDEDYEEDEYDEDDLEEMDRAAVVKIAKGLGIKSKDSEGEKRSKDKLIKLIIKKQG